MKIRRLLATTLCTLSMAFATTGAQAVPLLDLIDGAELQVNDKLFSEWILWWDESDVPVDLSLIDVTGLDDDPLNPGLRYDVQQDALTAVDENFIDLYFGFTVTVLDPDMRIHDNSLTLVETFSASGENGVVLIEEEVWDENLNQIGFKEVITDYLTGEEQLVDEVVFDSLHEVIFVDTNIFVASDFFEDAAGLIAFEQRFSQQPVGVPEPAIVVLMGFGLAAIGAVRRRKS